MATKNDLIIAVADRTNMEVSDVRECLNCFIDLMQETMLEGNPVSLKGFVKLYPYRAKGKVVCDFRTGERKRISSRFLPKSEFSKSFIKKIKEM